MIKRTSAGWSLEKALKTPMRNTKITIADVEYSSMRQAAKAIRVNCETLKARIKNGQDPFTGKWISFATPVAFRKCFFSLNF